MIRTIAFCVLLGLSAVRAEEKEDGDERLGGVVPIAISDSDDDPIADIIQSPAEEPLPYHLMLPPSKMRSSSAY